MIDVNLKELKKVVNITEGRRDGRTGYEDFIELFAIHISNVTDPTHRAEREKKAEEIRKRYTKDEQQKMVHFQNLFIKTLLGYHQRGRYPNIFMLLTNELTGFMDYEEPTPDDISELVGALVITSETGGDARKKAMLKAIDEKGHFVVSDSSVGTGGLLIGMAEQAHTAGVNYCEHMAAMGVELKSTYLHQSYIQLSLYGVPAVLIHGNTITLEEYSRWYTPMYVYGEWVWRCPLGMTEGKNASDEKLKMYQNPMYGAFRRAMDLFEPLAGDDDPA